MALLSRAMDALHAKQYEMLYTFLATAKAEGLALVGRFAEALRTIDDAIATARTGSSFDMPEMLRVKAQLLATISGPSDAEADRCLLQSLESAKHQKAIAWELRATMTLARLLAAQGRAVEGRERLSVIYAQFTQGLETNDLAAARKLLSELR